MSVKKLTDVLVSTRNLTVILTAIVCVSCSLPFKKKSNSASASASVEDGAAPNPIAMTLHHPERLSVGRCNKLELRFVDKSGKEVSGKFDEPLSISSASPADKFYINYFNPNDYCGTQISSFVFGPSDIWDHFIEISFKPSAVGSGSFTVIDTGRLNLPPITVSYNAYLIGGLKLTGPESQLTSDCSEIKVTSVLGDFQTGPCQRSAFRCKSCEISKSWRSFAAKKFADASNHWFI